MDSIIGFPKTSQQHDSIMVMVHNMSKGAHFIPIKSTHKANDVAQYFMKELF